MPLVVDLDGTLIKTDLLFETASRFITQHFLGVFRLLGWLATGRAQLKERLAEIVDIDPSTLPYNAEVIDWLREQKRLGRHLILATASHRILAEAVAKHLGLFDEVVASEGRLNIKGREKRDILVKRHGERGYDYVGDSAADLPVWQSANQAFVVSASRGLIKRARAQGNVANVICNGRAPRLRSLAKAMRPHQWVKNLLVFIPLMSAHQYGDAYAVLHACFAFVVFGLTASSVYILNDIVDIAHDRHHPRKQRRPFAAGDLSLALGWMVWPLLLVTAFYLAILFLPLAFVGALGTYFLFTVAYSLRLKQLAAVDVLTLAGLYTLRIIAGAVAITVSLTFWLLSFSMFLFLSLAFVKRFSELKAARDNGKHGRLRGRGYVHEDLEIVSSMGVASGYLSVLVLALYIQDARTSELYHTPQLIWLACPLMLFWVSRVWLVAHRGWMHDDPIVFALKDRASWIVVAGFATVFGLARVIA
ncbi:UbiA family prenyltransferase [Parasulfuritortus cantonensis]|uniref:UbiA family prenyltransferase n=1 Tax=Parasulfuritortus cantonensis TaxID=2528202 RepID=UPI00197F47A2|nr:UbiA family prenyltransferase [Parasulfuritortus cantonensis]